MNNHHINLQTAIDLTTRYRNNRPANLFICETFDAAAIQELLAVPGCAFLRIYLGRKPDHSVVAVLVAANESNEDILPLGAGQAEAEASAAAAGAVILEDGYHCPEACPPKSKLNA